MKKIFAIMMVTCFLFFFTACSSDNSQKSVESVEVGMNAMLTTEEKEYNYKLNYQDGYFTNDAKVFNKDLALLSFGASISTKGKDEVKKYLEDIGFEYTMTSDSYNFAPTDTSIGYAFGCKEINGQKTIAVIIRGFNYGQEWASNLTVGASGNHLGFEQSASIVYADLKNYLNSHNISDNIRLWITGYSRAGAVANVLSHNIISKHEINTNQNDMFVYTLEAPNCLSQENAVKYQNVFNIINSFDAIPQILPAQYGLFRCGTDIDISSTDIARKISAFDSEIVLPTFKPKAEDPSDSKQPHYANPSEFIDALLSILTEEKTDEKAPYDISTREHFANNIQPTIVYAVKLVFGLKKETLNNIIDSVKSRSIWEIAGLLTDDGIYNFIKPFIDQDGIEYDDAELLTYSNNISTFITNHIEVAAMLLPDIDNVKYVISMHFPEITYSLLSTYEVQK